MTTPPQALVDEALNATDGRPVFTSARAAMQAINYRDGLIRRLADALSQSNRQVYVPGVWRCAKCNFRLIQSNLNAGDATVTARDTPGEKCPNCDVPLWRVTWREEAEDLMGKEEQTFNHGFERGKETALSQSNARLEEAAKALEPFAKTLSPALIQYGSPETIADFRRAAEVHAKLKGATNAE